ncbi:hypothetical protein [Virgisporangium aurantiacum]|uniref:hypothetical protein n=1 Tax=Virgisporangium aurantiacum TaxID=175570 RepID=UPI001950CAD3|nr:hypothetical protein [Virgisporangium aurantiacum]
MEKTTIASWSAQPIPQQSHGARRDLTSANGTVPAAILDWSDRKRITATALAWIGVTQGEHRYAPLRHSPGATPGTTEDRGLAVDRSGASSSSPIARREP